MIGSLLGLEFHPDARELRLNNPVLPSSLNSIRLRNVRLGDSVADFIVRSSAASPTLEVLRADGDLRISIVLGEASP